MRTHIEALIAQQHANLSANLSFRATTRISCCDLKEVHFTAGGNPNYTDLGQISLYLLRYGPAYTVEYYKAYEAVLAHNHLQRADFSISSIGCGAYIDKASAFYAIQDYNVRNQSTVEMTYTGIDIVNWGEDVIQSVPHRFVHKGIQQLLPVDISNPINVLMFPKSLPEIPQTALLEFLQNMNSTCFQNKMCIISSCRNSDSDIASSNSFVEKFCSTFSYDNISTSCIGPFHNIAENRDMLVWEVFRFNFCQEAIDISKCIFKNCTFKTQFLECATCQSIIDQNPMLYTSYFNTGVYLLEKTS